MTSTSSTEAAERIDECADAAHAIAQPASGRPPRRVRAVARAACSAERFPDVPPETKVPPAVTGQPSRSRIQASASFSAKIAPAPASQIPPKTLAALVARSKATAARVGADGMKARFIGSSCARVAGTSTVSKTRSADSAPMPSRVIVTPASRCSSSGVRAEDFGSVGRTTRSAAQSPTIRAMPVSSPKGDSGMDIAPRGRAVGRERR